MTDGAEKKVEVEKGTILGAALLLIATGANFVAQLRYIEGMSLLATGILLIYIREHLKFHRWGHMTSSWRGKTTREIARRKR